MIPAFATAMQDRTLRGAPREVYVWFHENLDVVDYRSVKHAILESELGMDDSTIAAAVARLVERGYVARGERDGRLWTYRLVYSVPQRLIPSN